MTAISSTCSFFRLLPLPIVILIFTLSGSELTGNNSLFKNNLFENDNDSLYHRSPHFYESIHDYSRKPGWKADPEVVKDHEQRRPQFLWNESAVPDYELPDPLLRPDGTRVRAVEHWPEQRSVTMNIFREYMFGRRPVLPVETSFELAGEDIYAMGGAATLRRIDIRTSYQGRNHSFELLLFLPNHINEPVPVFLLMNNRPPSNTDPTRVEKSGFWPAEEVIARGYGVAAIQNSQLAPDNTETFNEEVITLFEGDNASKSRPADAWAAISAWGWGASRAMDYFETDDRVDCSKIAVLGHSRGGKASLWAGAEDQRFSLVISNNSGCGGAALSKRMYGETVQAVNRFTHWFAPNFMQYNDNEDKLHFDQHMLVSLIAPRAVYIASADEDLWADPRGEFLALANSSPVYGLWGLPPINENEMPPLDGRLTSGPRGYHVRTGGHNLTPLDWHNYMDFADRLWQRVPSPCN